MKIGILLLDNVHHVYHAGPVAFELSRAYPELDVELPVSHPPCIELLETVARRYPGQRCRVRWLRPPLLYRLGHRNLKSYPRKSVVLKNNRRYLASFDAIVSTDFGCLTLKKRFGLKSLRYIYQFHGAGDRIGPFTEDIKGFDFLLVHGTKYRERLIREGLLPAAGCAIIGYPKFDLLAFEAARGRVQFAEERPIVLYNPHFLEDVSSWHRWGMAILDYFYHSSRFNLIFAPHIMLFEHRQEHTILDKYCRAGNIHIDTGSLRSIDMTYTQAADIYLGDASSQVFEFLVRPRPCIFLNAQQAQEQSLRDYGQWRLGPVIDDVSRLHAALISAPDVQHDYIDFQKKKVSETFDSNETAAPLRAAHAIMDFLRNSVSQNTGEARPPNA